MKAVFYGRTGKWIRRTMWFLLDLLIVYASIQFSVWLRYDGAVNPGMYRRIQGVVPMILACYAAASIVGQVYDMLWRYAGAREMLRIAAVYLVGCLLTLLWHVTGRWRISRPILVMTALLAMVLVIAARFLGRQAQELLRRNKRPRRARILIVGAGEGGAYAARICRQNLANLGVPVAFADDDPLKRRMRVSGIPVCGTIEDIPELVK